MNNIVFFENKKGISELWNQLEELRKKSKTDKNARIQYNQITIYIQLLQNNGNHLPEKICKHLEDGIWELRPGNNRVLYCFFRNNEIILLHMFKKKTRKHLAENWTEQKENGRSSLEEWSDIR